MTRKEVQAKSYTYMMDQSLYRKLEECVTDVFSLSVEPHLAYYDPDGEHSSRAFYDALYVRRPGEDKEFLSFLGGNKTILIVTGHVGVGKSTFVREKYQNAKCCVGIAVDLKHRESHKILQGDFDENLRDKVAHAAYDRLYNNFRIHAAMCDKGEWHDPIYDYAIFQEHASGLEITEDHTSIGEIKLATYVLTRADYLRSDALSSVRAKYGNDLPTSGHHAKRIRYQDNIISGNVRQALDDIRGAMKYREWLRCYQLLYQQSLPLVVFIDNADVLDAKHAGGKVYPPIVDMESYLNHWDEAQIAARMTLPNIKFVFTVRDENVALINSFGRRMLHTLHISLGPENVHLPLVEERRALSTTESFISEIVEKRLLFLANRVKKKHPDLIPYFSYLKTIFEWWFEANSVGGRGISNRLSQINLIELNNYSISQILEHIAVASLQMLQSALWCEIEHGKFDNEFALIGLRGRVIRAAWSMPHVKRLELHWRGEFERECNGAYLGLSRLVLTRLVNQRIHQPSIGLPVRLLHEELQRFFSRITIEDIKGVLFALHESTVGQEELISIQQIECITCPSDIDDTSAITAMVRGVEMVDRIFIQLDFFGEIISDRHSLPKRLGVAKMLMEMTPAEAFHYIDGIYKLVISKLSQSYRETWCKQFCAVTPPEQTAFDALRDAGFTFSRIFYIERCYQSHITTIKTYLGQCLLGAHHRLILSPSETEELCGELQILQKGWNSSQITRWQSRKPYVHELDDSFYQDLLKIDVQGSYLSKIWRIVNYYSHALTDFRNMRQCRGLGTDPSLCTSNSRSRS